MAPTAACAGLATAIRMQSGLGAHAADFADAEHLARTFYQMVGMAPSVLMRGSLAEIPSPFSVSA